MLSERSSSPSVRLRGLLFEFSHDDIIKDTHRGLWYEDDVLTRILEAGHYVFPKPRLFGRVPKVEVILVDVRERDLRIKG